MDSVGDSGTTGDEESFVDTLRACSLALYTPALYHTHDD